MRRYYKRKIAGGSIFGQVFDVAKRAFTAGTKILSEKLPFAKKLATEAVTGVAKAQATKLGDKAVQKIIEKIKETKKPIQQTENTAVESIPEPKQEARMIINRLLSGSGFKKL